MLTRITFRFLLSGLVLLAAFGRAQSTQTNPHVFQVSTSGCPHAPILQTGFRVAGQEGIYTALHGVLSCDSISAVVRLEEGSRGPFHDLEIAKVDIARDVALLTSSELTEEGRGEGLKPGSGVDIGSKLSVIGYPYDVEGQVESHQFNLNTPAFVTIRERLQDKDKVTMRNRGSPDIDSVMVLALEGSLLPGLSGAPVLDGSRAVVGIGLGGLEGGFARIGFAAVWDDLDLRPVTEVGKQLGELASKDARAVFSFPLRSVLKVQFLVGDESRPVGEFEIGDGSSVYTLSEYGLNPELVRAVQVLNTNNQLVAYGGLDEELETVTQDPQIAQLKFRVTSKNGTYRLYASNVAGTPNDAGVSLKVDGRRGNVFGRELPEDALTVGPSSEGSPPDFPTDFARDLKGLCLSRDVPPGQRLTWEDLAFFCD